VTDLEFTAASADDEPFLVALFVSARPHLQLLPIDGPARDHLIGMQRRAQELGYRAAWPEQRTEVVRRAGDPIAMIMWADDGSDLVLLDIAVDPALRGAGLGTSVLQTFLARAARRGGAVRLMVARDNPAQHLYRRLGFVETGSDEVYLRLRWVPSS
jgi:ribosomal protein S18 acetylase RimI-like enzyme